MRTAAPPVAAAPGHPPTLARVLARLAAWAELLSRAAVGVAYVGTVAGAVLATSALAANVFTRYVLGYSILGADEFASWAFLWVIWLGLSLAVKRGAVTTITLAVDHGPGWWRRGIRTFAAGAVAAVVVYGCWRSIQYAASPESVSSSSPGTGQPFLYAIVSMTVGFWFIAFHFLPRLLDGAARLVAAGREGLRWAAEGVVGGAAAVAIVWLLCYAVLAAGGSKFIALGIIFVALTLAGTPIVFMLAIVGIISTLTLLGLTFYPDVGQDQLFPFRTTQEAMGLSTGSALIVC